MTATGMKSFAAILRAARRHNASDVHLVAGLPPALRVGGEIVIASNVGPLTPPQLVELRDALLTAAQQDRFEKERELSVSYLHEEYGRIRLSLYHRVGHPEMAIRMCSTEVSSGEELMLPAVVEKLAERTAGLIIITGPTGMGKTTTMNYMIDLINASRRAKIVTIEDPVEFDHRHRRSIITQIEVGTDTNTFAHCLRHVLRLDPDVIAVGEMRDLDTMETALTAAETGHLVLATLHTPSAAGTIERIVGSFDGSRQPQIILQLASTLLGAIAQRLIPSADKKRRILATEVLLANSAVRNMIRENKLHQIPNAILAGRAAGMHTLEDSLADLYRKGLVTYDHALAAANSPAQLRSILDRSGGLGEPDA